VFFLKKDVIFDINLNRRLPLGHFSDFNTAQLRKSEI